MNMLIFALISLNFVIPFSAQAQVRALNQIDPFFNLEWALKNDGTQNIHVNLDSLHTYEQKGVAGVDIGWSEAQNEIMERATSPTIVAVIDSGIDITHPELADRFTSDSCDILLNKGNTKDCIAPQLIDDQGHGTHVSGLIAAITGNGIGIAGAAPRSVKILALRVLTKDGYQNYLFKGRLISDYVADAVIYAVAHHASVINLSLGWPKIVDTERARNAIQDAIKAGVVVVAAAGNDRKEVPSYPCAYDGVICVGAISNNGTLASFSNFGGQVDVLAPGDSIASLFPINARSLDSQVMRIVGYDMMSGTSQSTPLISAMVAILKSVNPRISFNELRARLFAATVPLPAPTAALYGVPKIKQALDASPQTVYLPNFKGQNEAIIDEKTLTASGTVSVQNLWKTADQVRVTLFSRGQVIGSGSAAELQSGEAINIKWSYLFSSLDLTADFPMTLQVSDASGTIRKFYNRVSITRQAMSVPTVQSITIPQNAQFGYLDWLRSNGQNSFPNIKQTLTYGSNVGAPVYATAPQTNGPGAMIQFFDPADSVPVHTVVIPSIKVLDQVFRLDLKGNGKLAWVITGNFQTKTKWVFQFYFLDESYQPLLGTGTPWQIAFDLPTPTNQSSAALINMVERSYIAAGSWIKSAGGDLIPSFVSNGPIPEQDNFAWYDTRHYTTDTHLYYLNPKGPADSVSSITQLELRVVDDASFRKKYTSFKILNSLLENSADMLGGYQRMLVVTDDGLNTPTYLWDVRSVLDQSVNGGNGWDSLASSGQVIRVYPGNSSALLNFYGTKTGGLAWANEAGQFLDQSDFSYNASNTSTDQITGLKGIFDLGKAGRFIFLTSIYNLVGIHDGKTQMLPLNRDSSFPTQAFSDLLTPVIAGNSSHPLPGIFVDSTKVQGDQVSVALWDTDKNTFSKPIRYSVLIPKGCIQLSPFQKGNEGEFFSLPLLCQSRTQIEFRVLQPGRSSTLN